MVLPPSAGVVQVTVSWLAVDDEAVGLTGACGTVVAVVVAPVDAAEVP
jgi:hypothetical protein